MMAPSGQLEVDLKIGSDRPWGLVGSEAIDTISSLEVYPNRTD